MATDMRKWHYVGSGVAACGRIGVKAAPSKGRVNCGSCKLTTVYRKSITRKR